MPNSTASYAAAEFAQYDFSHGLLEFCTVMPASQGECFTLFGLFAVSAMLVCYGLEDHGHWFVLLFAVLCALGSAYGFLQGAWPCGLVEAVWAGVALRRRLLVRALD